MHVLCFSLTRRKQNFHHLNVSFEHGSGAAELALAHRFKALQAMGQYQYSKYDIDYDNWKLDGSGEFDGHLGNEL